MVSVLCHLQKVKLIDGWKPHVTMAILDPSELHSDYAFFGRETEDRASPILVGRFSKGRWLITHRVPRTSTQHQWIVGKLVNDVIMSGVQTLVVKSDQEVSIVNVKNSLMRELHGVEGFTVVPEESPVGASAANAVIEKSVWEMQSTTRETVAYSGCMKPCLNQAVPVGQFCGVLRRGGQLVSKEPFRMGRQRMNAGSSKATAMRLFRSVNW